MEENRMLEQIWSEAQTIETPKDLSPERIKERIEMQAEEEVMKKKGEKRWKSRKIFSLHGYGSRVAAAVVVLALSLGAYDVAGRQDCEPSAEREADGTDHLAVLEDSLAPTQPSEKTTENGKLPDENAPAAADEVGKSESGDSVVKKLGGYHLAESYEEVYRMVADMQKEFREDEYSKGMRESENASEGVVSDMASSKDAGYNSPSKVENESMKKTEQASEKPDYSTTNLQVTGVDESDIVKTDGEKIYIAANDQVRIVDVTSGKPRQLGSIKPQLDGNMDSICEMYVSNGRLLLIVQIEESGEMDVSNSAGAKKYSAEPMEDMAVACGYGCDYSKIHTQVLTYDITASAGARLVGTYEQDGRYDSSRKIGNMLYLFTHYGFSSYFLDGMPPVERVLPGEEERSADEASLGGEAVFLNEEPEKEDGGKVRLPQVQGQTIPENCIYLPEKGVSSGVVISAVNITRPEEVNDQKFICNGGGELYVTGKSIYLYESSYIGASERPRTSFSKFKIGDGKITADCAEAVPGFIEDTFAIHETVDGYLYVLTTEYRNSGTTNQLYVLNDKMKIHGKIEHIADGETVYAARFVDDIGYFVTYRNMDPLFTVDFSDPKNPKLIGELEIPGFSDYLQFWDDKHLVGVGEERKKEDSAFVGIKVSLYDISDPTDVKETSKIVIEDANYSPAAHNYKTLLADRGKNVIAFLTGGQDKAFNYRITQQVFTVKDGKLVQAAEDELPREDDFPMLLAEGFRNLYIGDRLYLAAENVLVVYDMKKDFKQVQFMKLD